jgi:hypothetical protein
MLHGGRMGEEGFWILDFGFAILDFVVSAQSNDFGSFQPSHSCFAGGIKSVAS